jgi:flagellar hook-associated protein 3 FlgL
MSTTSLGDLAQSFTLRQRNATLRTEMSRLTEELSTGRVSDVRQVLQGNYSYLTDLERKLDVLNGYKVTTTEATHFAAATQSALERVENIGEALSSSLITSGNSAVGTAVKDTVAEARNALEALMATLNTKVSGRSLFGGTATDRPPLADADDLLSALGTALSGATNVADIQTAAQAWFDDPAGFDALIYQGSDTALSPFALSDTEKVSLDVRATDPRLKDLVRLVAVTALADDASLTLSTPDKAQLFVESGTMMLGARDGVISLRAGVGYAEARVDSAATRNAAEMTSLDFARGELLGVDPYETATKLEDIQFQLQSLYSVTVRMSQLSLVNFL